MDLQPCGTHAAFKRHYAKGEKPCDPCREAASRYRRRLRTSEDRTREIPPCGTITAYHRHKRYGEPICEPCREARRSYDRNSHNLLVDREVVVCRRCGYRGMFFSAEEALQKARKHKCS